MRKQQDPWTGTLKWNAAIIYVISYMCAVSAVNMPTWLSTTHWTNVALHSSLQWCTADDLSRTTTSVTGYYRKFRGLLGSGVQPASNKYLLVVALCGGSSHTPLLSSALFYGSCLRFSILTCMRFSFTGLHCLKVQVLKNFIANDCVTVNCIFQIPLIILWLLKL